jgi:hypothetical protein
LVSFININIYLLKDIKYDQFRQPYQKGLERNVGKTDAIDYNLFDFRRFEISFRKQDYFE